jgi:S1-C subfamily serine protease
VDISRDGTDFRAVFVEAPLGLTLTKGPRGIAVVTKVADGGQAERLGVSVGDTVVGVGSLWVHGFDDVMGVLPKTPYPVALVLRRGLRNMIGRTGAQVVKGSQVRCVE